MMRCILVTLTAAAAQTGRNCARHELSSQIGTAGVTAVRFIFGLPFALVALALWSLWQAISMPGATAMGWLLLRSAAQAAATALMLVTMQSSIRHHHRPVEDRAGDDGYHRGDRSGRPAVGPMMAAIATATAGVHKPSARSRRSE